MTNNSIEGGTTDTVSLLMKSTALSMKYLEKHIESEPAQAFKPKHGGQRSLSNAARCRQQTQFVKDFATHMTASFTQPSPPKTASYKKKRESDGRKTPKDQKGHNDREDYKG